MSAPFATLRVDCPHAHACAGCLAIDEPYATQLEHKGLRVDRALARFATLAERPRAPVEPADPIVGYRVRAKLVVDDGAIGLYAREGDHVVVDIPDCRVLPPTIALVARTLREHLATAPELRSVLLAIDVREAITANGPELLLTLVLDEAIPAPPLSRALRVALDRAGVVVLATSTRPRRSPQLLGRGLRVVSGPDHVDELVDTAGAPVEVPAVPGGFVQAHRGQAAKLRAHVVARLEEAGVPLDGARVIDAYAGSGVLGLGLAAAGARVLLVESYEPAVLLARHAAEARGLAVKAVAADAEDALGELARRGDRPDVVVLNPPRRGVAPGVRRASAALRPRRIVYVSCEPDTFARDLDHFARLGYAPDRVEPFDLIPLSREVESVAILAPSAPPPLHVLHAAPGLRIVERSPHESRDALLARVRAHDELASAVLFGPDEDVSGAAFVATSPAEVGAWSQALAAGQLTYVTLARGIVRPKGSVQRAVGDVPHARTRYRRTAVVGGHSLVEARPDPARADHVLAHLASLGHPVLGATRHGHAASTRHFAEQFALDRPFLHLSRVELTAPNGDPLDVRSALPGDLDTVLARLREAR